MISGIFFCRNVTRFDKFVLFLCHKLNSFFYFFMRRFLSLSLALLLAVAASAQQTEKYIDEIVVTGSNSAVGRNLLPYTVTTVSDAQIVATGKGQLLSVLSGMVPGLFVTERNILGFGVSNGGAGGIKIRGVGGSPTNAVLMMVDGQPQFAGIYSHHVADFYETEYVDRVEVLRGPGSVLYGSNAMGGVINVITKEAAHDGTETTASTQYGSYNT
jgi:iron complex outermembrane receptor protein